jgi:hypothetical protein
VNVLLQAASMMVGAGGEVDVFDTTGEVAFGDPLRMVSAWAEHDGGDVDWSLADNDVVMTLLSRSYLVVAPTEAWAAAAEEAEDLDLADALAISPFWDHVTPAGRSGYGVVHPDLLLSAAPVVAAYTTGLDGEPGMVAVGLEDRGGRVLRASWFTFVGSHCRYDDGGDCGPHPPGCGAGDCGVRPVRVKGLPVQRCICSWHQM